MPTISDRGLLAVMRSVLVGFTALVLLFALNSEASIFFDGGKRVQSDARGSLCPAPGRLVLTRDHAGRSAPLSAGLATWLVLEGTVTPDQVWPPQLVGAP